jgi:hypothetical protein
MAEYIEQYIPVVQQVGLQTKKNIILGGSANLDLSGTSGFVKGFSSQIISGQGATATLTTGQSGAICLFDRAAGIIYTLPAPVPGNQFTFLVTVSVTSNNHKIITDTGTTLLIGQIANAVAAGTNTTFIGNGTTHISLTQNGTTTGGLIGSWINLICTTTSQWIVDGVTLGSGTVATPFATT